MKLLFDYLPIIIFYIFYKLFDIYVACTAIMVTTVLQVILYRIIYKRINKMLVILSILIIIFAGSTLIFHDPEFIKWKVSVVYWIFGVALFVSEFIGSANILQRFLGDKINMPSKNWRRLNLSWVGFFLILGFINLYIIMHYSTNTWVNFKLFGTLGLTLLFIIAQVPFLYKHVVEDPQIKKDETD